jgi:MFS family permease
MQDKGTSRIKLPFFYGWIIVGAGAISGSFNLGSAGFATSTFLAVMQADLGWNQTVIFGALSVRVLLGGLMGPIVGPLADHPWAPRVILPIGSIFLALSFILLRWVETPFEYYMVYGVLGAIGVAAQGGGMWQTLAIKWFVRKRAKALSWSNAGAASGPLIFPLFLTFLIGSMGWRDAWLWLGITTLIIFLVPALRSWVCFLMAIRRTPNLRQLLHPPHRSRSPLLRSTASPKEKRSAPVPSGS